MTDPKPAADKKPADPKPAADKKPAERITMVTVHGDGIDTSPCGVEHLEANGYFRRGSPEHRAAVVEFRASRGA